MRADAGRGDGGAAVSVERITLRVPIATPNTSNGGQGFHWSATSRMRKAQRETVGWHLFAVAARPELPVVVTIERESAGTLDDDGLRSALKSVRDAIADWLDVDDGDVGRLRFAYRQRKSKRGEHAVTITIETKRGKPC